MEPLSYAYGTNHFDCDHDLQMILEHFWPQYKAHTQDLHQFGSLAGRDLYEAGYHIDREGGPVLIAHDLDGNRIDRVRLSPVQSDALKKSTWMMAPPYQGQSWMYHYALLYLLADPGLGCILTITGQTAYALHKYATDQLPEAASIQDALLSGRAFGATWMTESQGGSDLGANQTVAKESSEGWLLTGDKYFASGAGLTDYAIVTARPRGAPTGPKGLALFLLPRLKKNGQLNYHVRRLKDKSATRAVPSGEVELEQSQAYLIGDPNLGIYYTLETLTVSRLANSVVAMAIGQKARLEVLSRVTHRRSFGHPLTDHPLIRRDLLDLRVRLTGGLALAFYGVQKFNDAWMDRPPYTSRYHLARLVTHLAKSRTADHSAAMTAMAMELFGGLGFLEEYAIARWHREALITPIWEGPSNIQALDFLETLKKKSATHAFLSEIIPMLDTIGSPQALIARDLLEQNIERLTALSGREAEWYAKDAMTTIADATQVALLYDLAHHQGAQYERMATLYASHFLEHQEYPYGAEYDRRIWGGIER